MNRKFPFKYTVLSVPVGALIGFLLSFMYKGGPHVEVAVCAAVVAPVIGLIMDWSARRRSPIKGGGFVLLFLLAFGISLVLLGIYTAWAASH